MFHFKIKVESHPLARLLTGGIVPGEHLPGPIHCHNTSRGPSTGKASDRETVTGIIYRGPIHFHNTSRGPPIGKVSDRGTVTGNIYRGPDHRTEPPIPKPRLASTSKSKSASSNEHTTNGHFIHIIPFSCDSNIFILDQRSHPSTSSYRTVARCHHHAFSNDPRHEGVPSEAPLSPQPGSR